jgi:hypothetical protein
MKHLIGKNMGKEVDFMEDKVTIKKLAVSEIMKIQEVTKKQKEGDELGTLRVMIRFAVEGAGEMKDSEIDSFPLDELSKLGAEIVKFSGMGGQPTEVAESGN